MGIRMIPEQFDEDRRKDPKRAAEARVFDALRNLNLDGYGLYEFRYRRGGRELDFASWLDLLGRFALQVKGGPYEMDEVGRWYLIRPDGRRESVASPLLATADASMELRNAIRAATGYKTFVVGVLLFPDMERNEEMERAALNHKHVHIIWGLDNLSRDLMRIASQEIFYPPSHEFSRNEWEAVNRIQYRSLEGTREGPRDEAAATGEDAPALAGEMPLSLGSATINIQHVERLTIMSNPPSPETGQTPQAPGA